MHHSKWNYGSHTIFLLEVGYHIFLSWKLIPIFFILWCDIGASHFDQESTIPRSKWGFPKKNESKAVLAKIMNLADGFTKTTHGFE